MPWKSRWFVDDKSYKEYLIEDIKIRKALMEKLKLAGITSVEIERLPKSIVITLTVSRPCVVIGRGGSGIEDVKKDVINIIRKLRGVKLVIKIDLHVVEVKNPELSAYLVAGRIPADLERRFLHGMAVIKPIKRVMYSVAKGVKVVLAGRINGADIARSEGFNVGSVQSQT